MTTNGHPFLYFSYGSNLDIEHLRSTCPSARFIAPARLDAHRLAFTLESKNTWHGGVPDILPTPGDTVWGALYLIDAADSSALDDAEGVSRTPPAYARYPVTVTTQAGDTILCRSYHVVTPNLSGIAPSPAFKCTLLRGARTSRLPDIYVAQLAAIADNGYAG